MKVIRKIFAALLLAVLLFLLDACEKAERINPWDPETQIDPNSWAPQNPQIESVNLTTKKLRWDYGNHVIEGFKVERRSDEDSWQMLADAIPPESRTWTDNTARPDTNLTFEYRLFAFAGPNESDKKSMSFNPVFPGPEQVQAYAPSPQQVSLSWEYPFAGHDGYKIDRRDGQGEWISVFMTSDVSVQTFVDTEVDLNLHNEYVYRVYAYVEDVHSEPGRAEVKTPEVITHEVTQISYNSAKGGGQVTDDKNGKVISQGIVWSTTEDPTLSVNEGMTEVGNEPGPFSGEMVGLEPETIYFARAYAVNVVGVSYGENTMFTTGDPCGQSFTDPRDGNSYETVLIGEQCWMRENLKFLPAVSPPANGSISSPHYYVYEYHGNNVAAAKSTSYFEHYGVLYNWPAAQDACPPGWYLPGDEEWAELVDFVVSNGFLNNNESTGAGNALKSCRQVGSPLGGVCNTNEHPRWNANVSHYGFDEFGFSALPGGFRSPANEDFGFLGENSTHWTSTAYSFSEAYNWRMRLVVGNVSQGIDNKSGGVAVRCVRGYPD